MATRTPSAVAFQVCASLACLAGQPLCAAEPRLPPRGNAPVLRVEAAGPRSYVSGLAFSSDGQRLYAVGWDKAVQVWNRQPNGQFVFSPADCLRVPVGPELAGALNCLAHSSDGEWLAVAGEGYARGTADLQNLGWIMPAGVVSDEGRRDQGLIYVFNVRTRAVTLLRGHTGAVQALTFVRGDASKPPELVSVAQEQTETASTFRIRYWDAARGVELTSLGHFPSDDKQNPWQPLPHLNGRLPGLAAWRTGPGPLQACVAIAWGDQTFRVWELHVDPKRHRVRVEKTAHSTMTLLQVLPGAKPQADRLLVGAHGELWTSAKQPQPQLQVASIPSIHQQVGEFAKAAAFLRDDRLTGGRVAVVAGRIVDRNNLQDPRARHRLVIARTAPAFQVEREWDLPWPVTDRRPVVAASADGSLLALAGSDDSAIEIYRVPDLLAGKLAPLQTLQNAGLHARDGSFVKNGDAWGIQFRGAPRGLADRPRVLDVANRRIVPATEDWQPAGFDAPGWKVTPSAPGSHKLSVESPEGRVVNITLEPDQVVSEARVGPVPPGMQAPVLAVASHTRGRPLLQIYNATSGELLRVCTGHTERLRRLSFSSDGRMMLTIAEDRLLCVWSLANLAERNVGKHGGLPGVILRTTAAGLVVQSAPPQSELLKDDVIVNTTPGEEVVVPRTPLEFFELPLQQLPGSKLPVRVRRGKQERNLELVVGQAIDEARPLFSLLIVPPPAPAPGAEEQPWSWIGWHWLGQFDSSDEGVQRLLGWHFNTGEADRPATYAEIGEYKADSYVEDLLKVLIRDQRPPPRVAAEPKVSLRIRKRGGAAIDEESPDIQVDGTVVQLRTRDAEVVVDVTDVTAEQARLLRLVPEVKLDGELLKLNETPSPLQWVAGLSKVQRNSKVSASVQAGASQSLRSLLLSYRAPPPVIKVTPIKETDEARVLLRAAVTTQSAGLHVELLDGITQKLIEEWDGEQSLDVEQLVPLVPGDNPFLLRAWNADVPEADRPDEWAQELVTIRRSFPGPRIEITRVADAPDKLAQTLVADDAGVYVSPQTKVYVFGRISGDADLAAAGFRAAAQPFQTLDGFQANQNKDFEFVQEVPLQTDPPGLQAVVFEAAVGAKRTPRTLSFRYEPPLPTIESIVVTPQVVKKLPADVEVSPGVHYAGYAGPEGQVTAILQGALAEEYTAAIFINGALAGEPVQAEFEERHELTSRVTLPLGGSIVELRLQNKWGAKSSGLSRQVELRQPPLMQPIVAPQELDRQTLTFNGRMRSVQAVKEVLVYIDDPLRATVPLQLAARRVPGESDLWEYDVENLGFRKGTHQLQVTARNDDGASLEAVRHEVQVLQAADEPASIKRLRPAGGGLTTQATLNLQFEIKSKSAFWARILRDQMEPRIIASGQPVVQQSIDLAAGANRIKVQVFNAGGLTEETLEVSRIDLPVQLEIAALTSNNAPLQVLERPGGPQDVLHYSTAANAATFLEGRVTAASPEALRRLSARVWLNNYMFPTVAVSDVTGEFRVEVHLNKHQHNRIQVEVFRDEVHAPVAVDSKKTIDVDCQSPATTQELYLLLIGSGAEVKADGLRKSAQKFLKADTVNAAGTVWKSANFPKIYLYEAVNVAAPKVQQRLEQLVNRMKDSGPHALLMVYYQGLVTKDSGEWELGPPGSLPLKMLEMQLTATRGAHLIYLDVSDQNVTAKDVWEAAPHLGMVIANWKGKAQDRPEEIGLIRALEAFQPETIADLRAALDAAARKDPRMELSGSLKNLDPIRFTE